MQKITFEISDQFKSILAQKGITSERATSSFLEQLMYAYADDVLLGEAAKAAQSEGYIGTEESQALLDDMLNAKDRL